MKSEFSELVVMLDVCGVSFFLDEMYLHVDKYERILSLCIETDRSIDACWLS